MNILRHTLGPRQRRPRHPKRRRGLVPVLVAGALAASPSLVRPVENLPDLGDHSATILSSLEEERLGREFMRNAAGQLNFIEDLELKQYVNGLGRRLADYSDTPEQKFAFYLINDNTLNAFAVPGGHISVHTGLIMATKHEAELASVLAHEIAHVTQHHLARMLKQSQSQTLPALAAIVAAILLGGQAGQAALVATNAGLVENQLKYSRTFEREADSIGIHALARAGYDPRAMPAFFEKLQQWSRIQESNVPEFLRTHPLTVSRIAESASRAEQYPPVSNPDETDFFHARAKIRALYMGRDSSTTQGFAANLRDAKYEDKQAERYGYALALANEGNYDDAARRISELVTEYPDDVRYVTAKAQIEISARRFDDALATYRTARNRFPKDAALELYYANALVTTGAHDEARQIIKRALARGNGDSTLYALLARAEGESGNHLAAHQSLAEYHYLRGNLHEALRQLRLAKRYVGDSYYASASVEARTQEIERELRISGEDSALRDGG